jgi:cell division septal protein FtsQ
MTRARGASRPRFRLLPTVLLTLAILAVPTVVYAWGRSSSSFDIVTVEVGGTHLVPAKKTLKLLQKTYTGDNLFTVTAKDVRGTLQDQSFVAGVTVDRAFPHTLEVGITEYVPAAYALAGTRWYVVDESGYVICTAADAAAQLGGAGQTAKAKPVRDAVAAPDATAAAEATAADATSTDAGATGDPSVVDASGTAAAGGSGGLSARLVAGPGSAVLPLPRIAVDGRVREGAVLDDETTAQKLAVITALPNSYRRRLAAVEDKDGQLKLRFEDGLVATWGDAERTLAKTVALRTVLAQYEDAGKTCTEIDVSIPDRTLARPVL